MSDPFAQLHKSRTRNIFYSVSSKNVLLKHDTGPRSKAARSASPPPPSTGSTGFRYSRSDANVVPVVLSIGAPRPTSNPYPPTVYAVSIRIFIFVITDVIIIIIIIIILILFHICICAPSADVGPLLCNPLYAYPAADRSITRDVYGFFTADFLAKSISRPSR